MAEEDDKVLEEGTFPPEVPWLAMIEELVEPICVDVELPAPWTTDAELLKDEEEIVPLKPPVDIPASLIELEVALEEIPFVELETCELELLAALLEATTELEPCIDVTEAGILELAGTALLDI